MRRGASRDHNTAAADTGRGQDGQGKTGKARRARQDGQGKTGKATRARQHGQGNTGALPPTAGVGKARAGQRHAALGVVREQACRRAGCVPHGKARQHGRTAAARRGKATCALARSRGAWAGRRAAARGGPPAPGPAPAGTSTLQQDTATHHRPIVSRRPRPAPLLPPDVPRGTRGAVEHRRACARAARHGALLSRAAAHTGIKCDGDEAAADDADVDDVGLLRPRRPRL
jgi:hypothetical protein